MPQGPLAANVAKNPSNALVPMLVDANGLLKVNSTGATTPGGAQTQPTVDASGLLMTSSGGKSSTLNVTAAAVIKATPGRIARIIVLNAGTTGGAFTLNDCATTGAATTANQIFTIAYNAANNIAGTIFSLEFPVTVGLVVSAVPTGGTPQLAISWS